MNWQAQYIELMQTWQSFNRRLFEGALRTPIILIHEMDRNVLEIEDLRFFGTYQLKQLKKSIISKIAISEHLFKPATGEGGPTFDKFKIWIASNVLLHEMVHQHLVESGQMGLNERQHRGHGHKFTEVCNLVGARLELQPVYMHQRPYCYAWPDSALTRNHPPATT